MLLLTYKRRGKVANLFVVLVSMLLAASLFAAPTPLPDAGRPAARPAGPLPSPAARPAAASRSISPAASDDIRKVVPQSCVPATGQFIWNFEEEEIGNILKLASNLTCRTVVIHNAVDKSMKMTIIGKSFLTPKDAWDVLLASLAQKGLTMVEQGKTWTVVKRPDAKYYSTPFYAKGDTVKNNEEIGTLFYKAEHASQDSLKNIGKLLVSKDGMVESIGDQFVIAIDSNSNLRRLGNIFAQVDMEDAQNKVHILRLMNADSKTVEKQLRDLFDISSGANRPKRRNGADGGKTTLNIDKIIADERTNSLIIISDQDTFDKTQQVVAMLDVKDVGTNKGSIHVKRLRYADAKKVAETLNTVVQQGTRSKNRFSPRPRDESTNELFEGEVKVTAHEDTNTLVTVASANDYRSLLATINKLDVRKEQVYVEAVIMDINISDTNKVGIGLFSGVDQSIIPGLGGSIGMIANPGGQGIASGISTALTTSATAASDIGGLGNQSIGALAVLGNFLSGGVAGLVGPPIGKTKIPSFGAVLQALATNSSIDVLSTPYLLTTDNQEAVMSVGQKVPVIKGASSVGGAGSLGVPLQTIAYEDVKLTFKITPHVGEGNIVRLDIDQEVNELGQKERLLNADQYRINTKTAKTTIVLKDQQTGVIGGLMHNRTTTIDNKIPFLGDIPILGWLFKNRASESDRKSLALIITPYIIKTDDDYKKIVDRKMKEREEFANLYYGGKIQNYNKTVDYDKKAGPVSSMILAMDMEMKKIENGGPGEGTETIISPSSATSASDGPNIIVEDPAMENLPMNELTSEEASAHFEENADFSGGQESDFLYPEDSSLGVMEPANEALINTDSNE